MTNIGVVFALIRSLRSAVIFTMRFEIQAHVLTSIQCRCYLALNSGCPPFRSSDTRIVIRHELRNRRLGAFGVKCAPRIGNASLGETACGHAILTWHSAERRRRKRGGKVGKTRPNDHVREAALWRGSRFHRGRRMVITVMRERSHRSQQRSTSRFVVFFLLFLSFSIHFSPFCFFFLFLFFPRLFFPSLFDSMDLTGFDSK